MGPRPWASSTVFPSNLGANQSDQTPRLETMFRAIPPTACLPYASRCSDCATTLSIRLPRPESLSRIAAPRHNALGQECQHRFNIPIYAGSRTLGAYSAVLESPIHTVKPLISSWPDHPDLRDGLFGRVHTIGCDRLRRIVASPNRTVERPPDRRRSHVSAAFSSVIISVSFCTHSTPFLFSTAFAGRLDCCTTAF